MNEEKFHKFAEAYKTSLRKVVDKDLQRPKQDREYDYSPEQVDVVVGKMLNAIRQHPLGVNYNSSGIKNACKALGIKPTRKALFEFLEV